jgi:thioredoxin reductase
MIADPINRHWAHLHKSLRQAPEIGLRKNCGTGAGGFQPGNKCAEEGGNGSGTDVADTPERSAIKRQTFVHYQKLKQSWSEINDELLTYLHKPNSAIAKAKTEQLKGIVKEMYKVRADKSSLDSLPKTNARDMVVVGAGPGGMAAAIMGGADGLDTLMIDANTKAGGQSKFSSRIENYPGFPIGASGETLASNMFEQAQRVGADTKLGVKVTGIDYDEKTGLKTVKLSNGETVKARSVVIAGGIEFHRMSFPGSDSPDVVYVNGQELAEKAKGRPVVVIGGSNGAAQAALGIAKRGSHVTVLSRSPIDKGMSDYQVQALRNNPRINVVEGDEIAELKTSDKNKAQAVITKQGKTIPAAGVGIFIGGQPHTGWLPEHIKDGQGRITVNHSLETAIPGVFAVGDIRTGSMARIGSAVGDGQMAAKGVFDYFDRLAKAEKSKPKSYSEGDKRDQAAWDELVDAAFAIDETDPELANYVEEIDPLRRSIDPINEHWTGLLKTMNESIRKNCGTGSGGFQPGNDCAKEGGGSDGNKADSGGGNQNAAASQAHKDNPKIHSEGEAPIAHGPEHDDNHAYDKQHVELQRDPRLKAVYDSLPESNILKRAYTPGVVFERPSYSEANGWIVPTALAGLLKAANTVEIGEKMHTLPVDSVERFSTAYLGVGTEVEKADDHEGITDPHQKAAAQLQDLWATTSGDHNKWAQAVQQVAAEHFGLQQAFDPIPVRMEHGEDEGDVQKVNPESANAARILRKNTQDLVEKHGDVIRSFLQSTYENTQERLKAVGIDHVTLYRGMGADNMPIANEPRNENGIAFVGDYKLQLQPLSSFSTHFNDAWAFASSNSNQNALVMAVNVPREKIFSTAFSGPGCANEHELVVLGGLVNAKSMVSTTSVPERSVTPTLDDFWQGKPNDKQIAYAEQTGKSVPKSWTAMVNDDFWTDPANGLVRFADAIMKSGCGTGAGGFEPGNTCAKGEGGEGGSDKPSTPADAKVQAELTTLGMKRHELPQIAGDDKLGFLKELQAKGVNYEERSIAAKDLKGVQGEYDPQRVGELRDHIATGKSEFSKPLVSSDGYIIDGHHRWRAQYEHDPDSKLDVIQIGLPVDKLLDEVRQSPKAFSASINEVPGPRIDPHTKDQFAALMADIDKPDGGFTYQPVTEEQPKGGYVVSPYPERSFAKDKITATDLYRYIQKNGDLLVEQHHYIGGWHDPESGKVFLDVSIAVPNEKEAERIAIEKDQISYFDVVNKRVVTVNKHATSGGQVKKGLSTRVIRGTIDGINGHWATVLKTLKTLRQKVGTKHG